MVDKNYYKITDVPGFNPQIGRLVSMMDTVRFSTLNEVKGLTIEQLDYLQGDNSNTIASLLMHMVAVELRYQVETFEERKLNGRDNEERGETYGLDWERQEIKGNPLEFYLEKLNNVREKTLREFQARNDEWLFEERLWKGFPSNNYFIWFHVLENEMDHRGQIQYLLHNFRNTAE